MIWMFTAICLFALTFFKLGAVSVMAKLLMFGLVAALVAIAVLMTALIWTKVSSQRRAHRVNSTQ